MCAHPNFATYFSQKCIWCLPGSSPSASVYWWPFQRVAPERWPQSLTLHWEVSGCEELWREEIHPAAVSYCHCHWLHTNTNQQRLSVSYHLTFSHAGIGMFVVNVPVIELGLLPYMLSSSEPLWKNKTQQEKKFKNILQPNTNDAL